MAAPSDLTWQQFGDALAPLIEANITFVVYQPATEGTPPQLVFNLNNESPVIQAYLQNQQQGVIKALSKLLEAARNAQETLNDGKPVGDRLAAFPAPIIGATSSGSVPVTRSIASRAVLTSVTQINGATA